MCAVVLPHCHGLVFHRYCVYTPVRTFIYLGATVAVVSFVFGRPHTRQSSCCVCGRGGQRFLFFFLSPRPKWPENRTRIVFSVATPRCWQRQRRRKRNSPSHFSTRTDSRPNLPTFPSAPAPLTPAPRSTWTDQYLAMTGSRMIRQASPGDVCNEPCPMK